MLKALFIIIFLLYTGFAFSDANKDLLIGAQTWNLEKVNSALANGANVNVKNKYGDTPLMLAVYYNLCIDVAEYLIEKGADVNAKDNYGYGCTPLMIATRAHLIETIKILIQRGADVNIVTKDGYNALSFARNLPDNTKIVNILLKAGSKEGKKIDQGTGM